MPVISKQDHRDHRFAWPTSGWPLLALCFVVTILSIWLVFAGIAYGTYATAWSSSELFAGTVAQLLEHDIAQDLRLYDASLKQLAANAANPAIGDLPPPMRHKVLFELVPTTIQKPMVLLDKAGRLELHSDAPPPRGVDLANRPSFVAQRDGTVAVQPFIGDPERSWDDRMQAIVLSRPRVAPDGSFDGIVATSLGIDDLNRLLASVSLPSGSTIALVHRNGAILARMPMLAPDLMRDTRARTLFDAIRTSASGRFVSRSRFDGIERLVVYRQVGTFPLYLAVGLSTQAFLGTWGWRLTIVGLAFVGLTAIIVFLGGMLGRELRRRALAEQRLSQLAATDGLTGIANRRHFDEMLQREWRRAIRDGQPLSLLMVDGDYFKSFNDTYGHVEGDKALRLIAEALARSVDRPADLVARFGGEEFCILLPGTDREGAVAVAEAVRKAVADLAVPHSGSPLGRLTVSTGVACRWPRIPETVSGLVEVADAALYIAKHEGRDRIVLDDSDLRPPKVA